MAKTYEPKDTTKRTHLVGAKLSDDELARFLYDDIFFLSFEVGSRNAAAITAARPAQQETTNLRTGFFYSFGEIGSQLSWYMINTYQTIFCTDVVGLTAAGISL